MIDNIILLLILTALFGVALLGAGLVATMLERMFPDLEN